MRTGAEPENGHAHVSEVWGMSRPTKEKELALHERMLNKDRTASRDIFHTFMGPMIAALKRKPGCSDDDATDAAVDAVHAYLMSPKKYAPSKGRLLTYLMRIARNKAVSLFRKSKSQEVRKEKMQVLVAVGAHETNTSLEEYVEAKRMADKLRKAGLKEQDEACLKIILTSSRTTNTEDIAKVLKLTHLPPKLMQKEAKRTYDRLSKFLKTLDKEASR
jgi:DNA-directed RNA polymerase specialized sigma24 family protein